MSANTSERSQLDAAWRAVAAGWAARTTGLPVQWVRQYHGPIDVDAFLDEFQVPVDPREHERSFRELRAQFALRFGGGLFAGGTDAAA